MTIRLALIATAALALGAAQAWAQQGTTQDVELEESRPVPGLPPGAVLPADAPPGASSALPAPGFAAPTVPTVTVDDPPRGDLPILGEWVVAGYEFPPNATANPLAEQALSANVGSRYLFQANYAELAGRTCEGASYDSRPAEISQIFFRNQLDAEFINFFSRRVANRPVHLTILFCPDRPEGLPYYQLSHTEMVAVGSGALVTYTRVQ